MLRAAMLQGGNVGSGPELEKMKRELERVSTDVKNKNEELERVNKESQTTKKQLETRKEKLRKRTDEWKKTIDNLKTAAKAIVGAINDRGNYDNIFDQGEEPADQSSWD